MLLFLVRQFSHLPALRVSVRRNSVERIDMQKPTLVPLIIVPLEKSIL